MREGMCMRSGRLDWTGGLKEKKKQKRRRNIFFHSVKLSFFCSPLLVLVFHLKQLVHYKRGQQQLSLCKKSQDWKRMLQSVESNYHKRASSLVPVPDPPSSNCNCTTTTHVKCHEFNGIHDGNRKIQSFLLISPQHSFLKPNTQLIEKLCQGNVQTCRFVSSATTSIAKRNGRAAALLIHSCCCCGCCRRM